MAQKLKNLHVTKVDFVDEGANPRADIKLYKRKEPENPNAPAPVAEADLADSIMKRIADALTGFLKGKVKPVEKGEATSFKEKMNEVSTEKIRDEIWSVCYALQTSLGSIVSDEDLDAAEMSCMLNESVEDFYESIKGYASIWAAGNTASIKKNLDIPDETELPMLMQVHRDIGEMIEKAKIKKSNRMEGELEEMLKIDKSKMTPEEKATYDDIIKKYAMEVEEEAVEKKKTEKEADEEFFEDEAKKKCPTKKSASAEAEEEDIYKGLNPLVAKELKELRKRADESEERELFGIAKKYEVIGKKPEELVPTLKSLKAAGGTAYADMISILDGAVTAVEKSGLFDEIGKSSQSYGGTAVKKSASEGKIDTIAKAYIEKEPTMSLADAIAKAWEDHPELIEEYEEEAGF